MRILMLVLTLSTLVFLGCNKVKKGDWYEEIQTKRRFDIEHVFTADSLIILFSATDSVIAQYNNTPNWDSAGTKKPEDLPDMYANDILQFHELNRSIINENRRAYNALVEEDRLIKMKLAELTEKYDEFYLIGGNHHNSEAGELLNPIVTPGDLEKNYIRVK